ncbi:MAG TPA: hypothetical protein VIL46_04690 [Gemmataceae bacterium]
MPVVPTRHDGSGRAGVAGVAVHPAVPDFGKRALNDLLVGVDTDDTVAVWSGTLGQLIDDCGGPDEELEPRFARP